jgi:hypothetical protein
LSRRLRKNSPENKNALPVKEFFHWLKYDMGIASVSFFNPDEIFSRQGLVNPLHTCSW